MIAVTDTSPICYLILIGEVELLPKLFHQVLVPQAVIAELLHEDAPETVRTWASSLPLWIAVRESPAGNTTGMEKLQTGERGAILLAQSIQADIVLIDEKSARRVASDRSLRVTGTLGLLGEAAAQGLVELAPAIDHLRKTSFRYSPAMLKATFRSFRPATALAQRPVGIADKDRAVALDEVIELIADNGVELGNRPGPPNERCGHESRRDLGQTYQVHRGAPDIMPAPEDRPRPDRP
jgi:predicted nucleic acid-binding protein